MNEKRLCIGVDIASLRAPFTGIANYETQLLSRLLTKITQATFLGYGSYRWQMVDEPFLTACCTKEISFVQRKMPLLRYSTFFHSLRNQVRQALFSASALTKDIALYHAFSYRPPGWLKAPIIPVVYDLSTVRHPETHPKARLKWMQPLERLCRSAPLIHTISQFTAGEIETLLGVPARKIIVVPPGVNQIFLQHKAPEKDTLAKFSIKPGSYVMSVSTLEPRKNLRTLIMAYASLPQMVRTFMPLLIVGSPGWGEMDLPKSIGALEAEGSVRFAGYVSDRELRDLYAGARALFYPSLYEGFGMPITEALACGTPVVASKSSSMPEAGGLVSRYVAPLDIEGWRLELERTLASSDYLDVSARQQRHDHARGFSWEEAASKVEAMYKTVLLS